MQIGCLLYDGQGGMDYRGRDYWVKEILKINPNVSFDGDRFFNLNDIDSYKYLKIHGFKFAIEAPDSILIQQEHGLRGWPKKVEFTGDGKDFVYLEKNIKRYHEDSFREEEIDIYYVFKCVSHCEDPNLLRGIFPFTKTLLSLNDDERNYINHLKYNDTFGGFSLSQKQVEFTNQVGERITVPNCYWVILSDNNADIMYLKRWNINNERGTVTAVLTHHDGKLYSPRELELENYEQMLRSYDEWQAELRWNSENG